MMGGWCDDAKQKEERELKERERERQPNATFLFISDLCEMEASSMRFNPSANCCCCHARCVSVRGPASSSVLDVTVQFIPGCASRRPALFRRRGAGVKKSRPGRKREGKVCVGVCGGGGQAATEW